MLALMPLFVPPDPLRSFIVKFALRTGRRATRRAVYFAAGDYLLFGSIVRPLPPHCVQRGGYILCPGFAACFTLEKPVPLHALHFRSDEGDLFLIRMPHEPSNCSGLDLSLTWSSRGTTTYGRRDRALALARRRPLRWAW
jgi:hypothetical protein